MKTRRQYERQRERKRETKRKKREWNEMDKSGVWIDSTQVPFSPSSFPFSSSSSAAAYSSSSSSSSSTCILNTELWWSSALKAKGMDWNPFESRSFFLSVLESRRRLEAARDLDTEENGVCWRAERRTEEKRVEPKWAEKWTIPMVRGSD